MRSPRSSSASSPTSSVCKRSRPPSTTSPRRWATSPGTGPTGTARRGTRGWRCSSARSSRPTVRSSSTPSSTTRRGSPPPTSAASWWPPSTSRTAARTSRPRCASSRRWPPTRPGCGRSGPRSSCAATSTWRARPIDVNSRDRDERSIGQRPEERALFERILREGGLHDVARDREPDNDALFTWWAPWRNLRQRNIGWRIDYLLVSGELAATVESCVSQREVGTSDHAPLVVTFK